MTAKHPLLRAACLLLIPPAVILLLFLLSRTDASVAVYLFCLWGVFLSSCILCSFFAGKQGIHPFLCTGAGFLLALLSMPGTVGCGLAGAVLGLISCVAGQEWQKQKTQTRRHGHGKQ